MAALSGTEFAAVLGHVIDTHRDNMKGDEEYATALLAVEADIHARLADLRQRHGDDWYRLHVDARKSFFPWMPR